MARNRSALSSVLAPSPPSRDHTVFLINSQAKRVHFTVNHVNFIFAYTVYPKKYAHGICFALLCCGFSLTDFPISIRLTLLALWQSNDCPSASKATLMNMDKYFMWIHYKRLHNHNKTKHNKPCAYFMGYTVGAHSSRASIIRFVNTLRLRQNGRHLPDDTFKCIFLNQNIWILIKISLQFIPNIQINNIPE